MADELVPTAEQFGRRTLEVELHKIGREDFVPERNSLQLCFSSPPYAGWERYSDEPTQSHIKFPTQDVDPITEISVTILRRTWLG